MVKLNKRARLDWRPPLPPIDGVRTDLRVDGGVMAMGPALSEDTSPSTNTQSMGTCSFLSCMDGLRFDSEMSMVIRAHKPQVRTLTCSKSDTLVTLIKSYMLANIVLLARKF